ncbi:MAG: acyltransferase family protein [Cytophaga sp.]|uniref:acyltransferase family protein n=1 Tax=Cytophaga sp. TaxID=29535 RepID=UPI003F7D396C
MLFSFGQEAVIVFFVLSGFVIYYSVSTKKAISVKTYLIARIVRIYPVFFVSIIITYLCSIVLAKELIAFPVKSFLLNTCMLQDFAAGKPGIVITPFLGNTPLWSLSYEWWFYMLFIPLFFYVDKQNRYLIVLIISILGIAGYVLFPNQISLWAMYFIIWWLGVEAADYIVYNEYESYNRIRILIGVIIFFLIIFSVIFLKTYTVSGKVELGMYPLLFIRHFSIAIFIVMLMLKMRWYIVNSTISSKNWMVQVAPYTYAIYIIHYPILVMFVMLGYLTNLWVGIPLYMIVLFICAYISEKYIHNYIKRLFYR